VAESRWCRYGAGERLEVSQRRGIVQNELHAGLISKDTPLCNAWLTLLRGVDIDVPRHGDSTGVISELVA